ncbi:MAG: hypothetical protein ACKO04_15070 [Actinomycetes bacterium]
MSVARTLSPADLADVLRACADVLADHAAAVDALELSEEDLLADGDRPPGPGTVLAQGLAAAAAAAQGTADLSRLGEAVAGTCADGRGRAGRFWAGVTSGWAEGLRNADAVDGARLALMFEAAAEALARADGGSSPGGPTAVAAAAADAALAASDDGAALAEVLLAAADGGLVELERGPVADPELARRGVVDATAAAFLLVVDVMASVVTGEPLPELPADPFPSDPAAGPAHRYQVRCRLHPAEGAAPEDWLADALAELGEVLHCSPLGATWTVEVWTGVPGAAVEVLCDAGRPRELHIAVLPAP